MPSAKATGFAPAKHAVNPRLALFRTCRSRIKLLDRRAAGRSGAGCPTFSLCVRSNLSMRPANIPKTGVRPHFLDAAAPALPLISTTPRAHFASTSETQQFASEVNRRGWFFSKDCVTTCCQAIPYRGTRLLSVDLYRRNHLLSNQNR